MSKEAHYDKGMDYFSEDKIELAIEELTKAVKEDPAYSDALHALAMCYYHLGDYDKAIEYGEQLSKVDPNNVLAYTSLSMFYQRKGMIEKAEELAAKGQAIGFQQALQESNAAKKDDG